MTYKVADGSFEEGLKSGKQVDAISKLVLKTVEGYGGSVHRKVVLLNSGTYSDQTIEGKLSDLVENGFLNENESGAYCLTEKGERQIQ